MTIYLKRSTETPQISTNDTLGDRDIKRIAKMALGGK